MVAVPHSLINTAGATEAFTEVNDWATANTLPTFYTAPDTFDPAYQVRLLRIEELPYSYIFTVTHLPGDAAEVTSPEFRAAIG